MHQKKDSVMNRAREHSTFLLLETAPRFNKAHVLLKEVQQLLDK